MNSEQIWQDAETAPRSGFFLVWGPHQPDMVFPYEAERFWRARDPSWPAHLSSRCFTHWMPLPPLPTPPKDQAHD